MARPHRGTRWLRFIFIRSAGMVHTRTSVSISDHTAPCTLAGARRREHPQLGRQLRPSPSARAHRVARAWWTVTRRFGSASAIASPAGSSLR